MIPGKSQPSKPGWCCCAWGRARSGKAAAVRPHNSGHRLDGDTFLVPIEVVTEITSKQLHEQTAAMLDRAGGGQRMKVIRNGRPAALLIPANEEIDPSWDEIMAEVRKARAQGGPTWPNPVLAERRKRHYAARVR